MTTVDHKARHVWARTPAGVRCAYMFCSARPDPAETARLAAEEARVPRIVIRMVPSPLERVLNLR